MSIPVADIDALRQSRAESSDAPPKATKILVAA